MSRKKQKNASMELPISSEELILAVQNRPFIYDSRQSDFNDKRKKVAAWLEICEEVIPNWSKLKADDDDACTFIEFELQKKWRNLRDCYTRAFKKQVTAKAAGLKVPKQYIYYDLLSFLEPMVSKRYLLAGKSISDKRNDLEEDESDELEYLNEEHTEIEELQDKSNFHEVIVERSFTQNDDIPVPLIIKPDRKNNHKSGSKRLFDSATTTSTTTIEIEPKKIKFKDNINNLIENINKQTNEQSTKDPDEMFLLSMLPYLKSINTDRKLETQIELMQLLKRRIDEQELD